MAIIDEQTEKDLLLATMTIAFKNLCDLLIIKGYITAEEYKKIMDDANNSLQEALYGGIKNDNTDNHNRRKNL